MFDAQLSMEIDQAQAMLDYHRTKLLYWRSRLRELEQRIETDSIRLQEEFDTIANEAWNDDRLYNN